MNIITSSIHNLNKSKELLNVLSDDHLKDCSVPPYHSCIGSHIRHILDFYDCIFDGLSQNNVDLTKRKRDLSMHESCDLALDNVHRVINNLQSLESTDYKQELLVIDDLGLGKTQIPYTLGGLLAQANSHAIHHYAIISYILDRLGIQVQDDSFGYNPSTPKSEVNLN